MRERAYRHLHVLLWKRHIENCCLLSCTASMPYFSTMAVIASARSESRLFLTYLPAARLGFSCLNIPDDNIDEQHLPDIIVFSSIPMTLKSPIVEQN